MLRIDFRHDHRHVRRPAVRAVIGHHRGFGLRVLFLGCANLVFRHVDCGEQEIHIRGDVFDIRHVLDDHGLDELRHRGFHLPTPADSLFVGLAGAVRRCSERNQLEPRVVFEQGDEALPDHAGCAENADLDFL